MMLYGNEYFGVLECNYSLAAVHVVTAIIGPEVYQEQLIKFLPFLKDVVFLKDLSECSCSSKTCHVQLVLLALAVVVISCHEVQGCAWPDRCWYLAVIADCKQRYAMLQQGQHGTILNLVSSSMFLCYVNSVAGAVGVLH